MKSMKNDFSKIETLLADSLWSDESVKAKGEHHFSAEYQNKKANVLNNLSGKKRIFNINQFKMTKKSLLQAAITILMLLCLIPATMVVADYIRKYAANKKDIGSYAQKFTFENPDDNKIRYVKGNYDFPKEYEMYSESGWLKFWKTDDGKYLYSELLYARSRSQVKVKNILDSEEITVNDNPAYLYSLNAWRDKEDDIVYDKMVLILYENQGFALKLYGSDTVSADELVELAGSVNMVETTYDQCDEAFFEVDVNEETKGGNVIQDNRCTMPLLADEEIQVQLYDLDINKTPINLRILSVEYPDKMDVQGGIFNSMFDKDTLDGDGTLKDCHYVYRVQGDGINTLSGKLLGSEYKKQYFVKVTMQLTNLREQEVNLSFDPHKFILLGTEPESEYVDLADRDSYYYTSENCVRGLWLWNDLLEEKQLDFGSCYTMSIPASDFVTTTFIFGIDEGMTDLKMWINQ